ncbi:MAG: molybdenum cofactor guanylyltransferase [Bacteroidales bacterium]|nr:molybdenum cofactor guanylyltransferase [Bacteroidales bacterium]
MVANNINRIDGYILAGGMSSRMGVDKGLLQFNDKPLVQRIIEQLSPAVNKVIIVSNNREYEKFGLEVIGDLIKNIGPAGGIHAALNHAQSEQLFIVSCDMPFITAHAATYIIQQAVHSQITLALHHGKVQALFGVYSSQCLPKWKQLIEQGIIKLQEMVSHFDLLKIVIEKNELFGDLLFTNINNENDFNTALKQLKNGN